jgi:hypothetical protein
MTNPSETATKLRNLAKWLDRENDESTGNIARQAADTIDRLTSSGEAVAWRFRYLNPPDRIWTVVTDKPHDDPHIEYHPLFRAPAASPREGHVEVPVEDVEALRVAREVISDMVRYGLISNEVGTTAYYVGDNVLPTIMGRALPHQGETKP